jgi:uncharacterized protein (UPF0276 family)
MMFLDRAALLPQLGIGVSTEYGAIDTPGGLDPLALRAAHPRWGALLEVGVETSKGLDASTERWVGLGLPTTYHFLDINLDEPEDFDAGWLRETQEIVARLRPAWLCGDAGMWHFGRRDRAHMLLLPPVLTDDSASRVAEGIVRLRELCGLEVLPENPPGAVWVGELHLLDWFARVMERADTGMVLDAAHLAIYQHNQRLTPLTGLDGFPLERVIEVHIAGGTERCRDGLPWIEDDHGPRPVPATWEIFSAIVRGAPFLRAVIHECERNPLPATLPTFAEIDRRWGRA